MSIKLLVGLRNPGASYQETRHNVGAWCAQQIADNSQGIFKLNRSCQGEIASFTTANNLIYIWLPTTFMNQSGLPVRSIAAYYKILPQEILVIHDEIDLPPGRVKLKYHGGHGGHNGLRDIMRHLDTDDFYRLRIGVGHPGDKSLVHDYVLSRPSVSDKKDIMQGIERAITVLPLILEGKIDSAMNELHR